MLSYFLNLLLSIPSPASPAPRRRRVEGSGTAFVVLMLNRLIAKLLVSGMGAKLTALYSILPISAVESSAPRKIALLSARSVELPASE